MKKKILFIGNRYNVLSVLLDDELGRDCEILALENSYLAEELQKRQFSFSTFSADSKKQTISRIKYTEFDILISNGCPFILPVSELKKKGQLFINIHPTFLPFLKGKTPINGVLFNEMKFLGATAHYMDDGIDTGKIIYQKKIELTDDLDLGLIYYLSFELEREVFAELLHLLKKSDFDFPGFAQDVAGSCFNRVASMMQVDFTAETDGAIIKKIRAFGIKGQGVRSTVNNELIVIYDAELITSNYIKDKFNQCAPGEILLIYDGKMLVKTKDSIIKIKVFERFHG